MRVTNVATFRNMTSSVNDLHGKLVKSYNKINSERAYESAAENPLAYYEGLNLDDQYQDTDRLGIMYIEIGNKYSRLEDTETRLTKLSTELKEAYTDKLGADPYEAIMEMYYHRYSYNAALQVSSNLMGSSLFDFMR